MFAKAGGAGKLFGAVTSQEISDALKEQFDIDIEKNKIVQAEPIKNFGSYTVKAKLGFETSGNINVLVVEA
jgi:large subunit ribosomal protein L9